MPTDSSLDVRQVVPRERHQLVLGAFESLKPGEGSSWLPITIPDRSAVNLKPDAPISSPGIISNKARQYGAFAAAANRSC
jgi:Uncharacterized conserved protein (DUF2249)